MLIDAKGEALIDEPEGSVFVKTGSLSLDELKEFREKFPAWRDADHFTLSDGVGF